MTAKEYYNLYMEKHNAKEDAFWIVFNAMLDEVKELMKVRHVKRDPGFLSAVGEMNDRWNAIRRIQLKNAIEGVPVFKRDGFKAGVNHVLKIAEESAKAATKTKQEG